MCLYSFQLEVEKPLLLSTSVDLRSTEETAKHIEQAAIHHCGLDWPSAIVLYQLIELFSRDKTRDFNLIAFFCAK